MQVTNQMTFRVMQSEINQINGQLQELRQQAATGKKLNQPSDDPSSVRPVLNYSKQIRDSQRYQENMGMALNELQAQDSFLEQSEDTLVRAKQQTINAIDGTLNEEDREILADQVGQLRKEMLDKANGQISERYIFAGYEERTQPFQEDDNGEVSYEGHDEARKVDIAPGEKLEVAIPGDRLFMGEENGEPSVFETLSDIEDNIRDNDTDRLNELIGELDEHMTRLRKERGSKGVAMNRVENSIQAKEQAENDLERIRSRYQDADIAKTSSQIVQQETALRAAFNVSSRIAETSILDYM